MRQTVVQIVSKDRGYVENMKKKNGNKSLCFLKCFNNDITDSRQWNFKQHKGEIKLDKLNLPKAVINEVKQ